MSNNISQEAALVGHIAEKGAPGKDGKTPVKEVDYWTPEDKANIIHEVLESDEYQSVKGLVGTKEKPVNFNLLESGVYVFQGYISVTAAGETTTNTIPCPKELLLVFEQSVGTNTDNELTYELYMKTGFLFHIDMTKSTFGNDLGAGVLAVILMPSSVKFLGEWPEDKKNDIITEMESSTIFMLDWMDNWDVDAPKYVTHDELSNVIANLATEQYVDYAISNAITNLPPIPEIPPNMATTEYVDSAISNITFPPSLTEDQVNALIDAKLGAIENGHY